MSAVRYREYKDSGMAWLGEVPKHWTVERIKLSTRSCKNGIWGNESKGDADDIPCVRVADFNRVKLTVTLDEPTIRNVSERERRGRVLSRGDLLLEKSGGGENQPVGCVVLYDDDCPAVCSNFVARIELAPEMSPSFWRYVHAAAYNVGLTTASIKQTSGIQNLDQDQYFNERSSFPPFVEQTAIAGFLDRETAKIDALVTEQEKLIALLKEKREAVISRAVTKGIDPSVSMKDSGTEWMGEVPEHWEVVPLKTVVTAIESGTSVNAIDTPALEGELGVLKLSCVYNGRFDPSENKTVLPEEVERVSCPLRAGCLVVSRGNTPDLVGAAGLVEEDHKEIFLSDLLWQVHFAQVEAAFVHYWTLTRAYRGQIHLACTGTSSSMQKITKEKFRQFIFPMPPLLEQKAVVAFLKTETDKLDQLVNEAGRTIELLKERRSALISATVTGKIDVRGLVTEEVNV